MKFYVHSNKKIYQIMIIIFVTHIIKYLIDDNY